MKKFNFKISGNEYGVEIKSIEDNIAQIEVNGTQYEVELEGVAKPTKTPTIVRKVVPSKAEEIAKKDKGSTSTVKAPLPGKIMNLKVQVGDIVKKGDVLLVMEAMKMEHTIRAPEEGQVEAFYYQPGDLVDGGAELLSFLTTEEVE